MRRLSDSLDAQRSQVFLWVPVCLALGIGGYFSLRFEPEIGALVGVGCASCLAWGVALRWSGWGGLAMRALALVAVGGLLAALRAHVVAGPVLPYRYYGPVTGRIVVIDRSASDAIRLTLDQVILDSDAPVPRRVRVSLHGDGPGTRLVPGKWVTTTAHLSPPQGAVEPGGFDFRRHAWFQGLGAVGNSRVHVLSIGAPESASLGRWRQALADRVIAALPGPEGGVAAAVLTGDRSHLSPQVTEALRATNLAHLLAISGLHMGLWAGCVFAALRLVVLCLPRVGLRWPAKKIAAAGALISAAGYLALSGGNVATERAFCMVGAGLLAILFDRRAISLHTVALAAVLVLTHRPESLVSPGFQMSFSATVALVLAFQSAKGLLRGPGWMRAVAATVMSSAVAGAATAPFAVAHFNQIAHYGLIANISAVPVMGAVVMPAGLIGLVLMPLGLEELGLTVMGWGLQWILSVARIVAGWGGAVSYVAQPPWIVVPLIALAGCWFALWRGPARWGAALVVAVALGVWSVHPRPTVLIAESGGLVGHLTEEGRALSRAKGSGFVARVWAENDGLRQSRMQAYALWTTQGIRHIHGKRAAAGFEGCAAGEVIVSNQKLPRHAFCTIFDSARLKQTGAVAGYRIDGEWQWVTAQSVSGHRLWSPIRRKPSRKPP